MPIEVAPNRIELSELFGGYSPDAQEAAVTPDASPAMNNLLPMLWGNELRLRNGYTRLSAGRLSTLHESHWIRHVWYYELIDSGARKQYIMCVLSNGTNASANNIQIWAYDLLANTFTRKDTADRAWAKAGVEHWAAVVEGTFYGGTRGEVPYSWHPTNGWDANPTLPTADTWVDSLSPGAGEVARDFAFKRGVVVLYSGKYYRSARNIRYKKWEDGQRYSKGEKASRHAAVGGQTYWRSYECISSHTAVSADNAPGTGTNTATYWKKRRLDQILDSDSEINEDWFFNPIPRKASVGVYHGNRLWVRADDNDNWARLQYSAPAKPEHDAEIADLDFDPTDWAAVDDMDGDGGGWITLPFSGKGDAIRALYSYGNNLIIAGRWQTYVIAGLNENTWIVRKLGNYGAVSNQSITECDGLVYMLGRHGILTVTDGTTIQPVPGMEKVRKWMKSQLDTVLGASTPSSGYNWFPSVVAHDGFIYISMPHQTTPASANTIIYDPRTAAFYPTDIRMLDMTTGATGGVERLFFSTNVAGGSYSPTLFKARDDPGSEVYTDDDPMGGSSTLTTAIPYEYRTAWFQFGMTRNERRIRRAWALVSGAAASSMVVRMFKNFNTTYFSTVTRTLAGTYEGEFVEGQIADMTPHAVAMRLSGSASAATSVHGFGLDTEPRRTRFHHD